MPFRLKLELCSSELHHFTAAHLRASHRAWFSPRVRPSRVHSRSSRRSSCPVRTADRLPFRLKLELCSSELPHFTAHLVVLSTRASFSRSLALIKSIALCAVALHGPIDCRLPEPSSPDAPCARSTRVVSFDAGSPDARQRASPYALAGASFSGAYGDLGAAVAAILLDREARSRSTSKASLFWMGAVA